MYHKSEEDCQYSACSINFSETEVDDLDSENEGIETYAGTSLRYSWNYNTYPYDFGEQKWSKNVDALSDDSDSCIVGTQSGRTIDGRYKTIYNLQLRDGEYIIAFTIDKVTSKNHYALYTGCPLPIMNTGMFAGTHNGRVSWKGGLKAETERVCPAVTISTPSGASSDLFAISKVWFENKAPSSGSVAGLTGRNSVQHGDLI